VYRNPRYFDKPLGKPDRVIVVGSWPRVVAAYQAIGVPVDCIPEGGAVRPPAEVEPPSTALLERIQEVTEQSGVARTVTHLTGDPGTMTDDELREHVEAVTGKKPHHRAGRAKMLEMLDGAARG
jgi:hypothetical protein